MKLIYVSENHSTPICAQTSSGISILLYWLIQDRDIGKIVKFNTCSHSVEIGQVGKILVHNRTAGTIAIIDSM